MIVKEFKDVHDVLSLVAKANPAVKHDICPNCNVCITCDSPHDCANSRALVLKAAA